MDTPADIKRFNRLLEEGHYLGETRPVGNRRTNEVWSTGRSLSYGYDRAHQLLSTVSTGRASDSVNYVYDKAGNPTSRKELGLTTAYTFNNLNQFASGSWTGKLTVIGEVNYAAGTVTVNGVTGKIFPDRVFEATNITVSAGTNVLTAVYHGPAFTNTQMVATNTSSVVVVNPAFGCDAKGNLTNDAEFVYQYDIANRLTNVISKPSGSSVLAARYDGLGRRVEVTRNGSTVERYVYFPGSLLVLAVLNGSNQTKEIYTHGPDLSGVVGGAGGIGGILSVSTNVGAASASKYFHADAMGNVILVSGSDGKQVASYGFTPFGKLVNQVGDYQSRFLFSSKELDPETGLVLYGVRYLNPHAGTFTSRDPLGEDADSVLYRFVFNSPLDWIDDWGGRAVRSKGGNAIFETDQVNCAGGALGSYYYTEPAPGSSWRSVASEAGFTDFKRVNSSRECEEFCGPCRDAVVFIFPAYHANRDPFNDPWERTAPVGKGTRVTAPLAMGPDGQVKGGEVGWLYNFHAARRPSYCDKNRPTNPWYHIPRAIEGPRGISPQSYYQSIPYDSPEEYMLSEAGVGSQHIYCMCKERKSK